MGIPKRTAIAVSSLFLAGGAVLVVGAAGTASAQTAAAPQGGCRGWGCSSSLFSSAKRFAATHQRIIVINRNNNFSKSGVDQAQFQRQIERDQVRPPAIVIPTATNGPGPNS